MTFVIALDVPAAHEEFQALDLAAYEASATVARSSGSTGVQLAQVIIEGADAVLAPVAAVVAAWIGARLGRSGSAEENGDDDVDHPITGRLILPNGRTVELSGRPADVAATLARIGEGTVE